eukprot:8820899-Alexandrium_andersonii.AAC.1
MVRKRRICVFPLPAAILLTAAILCATTTGMPGMRLAMITPGSADGVMGASAKPALLSCHALH